MVIVAVPDWLAAGVTRTVRLVPEPPKTILLLGTKVGLEDDLDRTRLVAGVSASPITKGIGGVAVFAVMT